MKRFLLVILLATMMVGIAQTEANAVEFQAWLDCQWPATSSCVYTGWVYFYDAAGNSMGYAAMAWTANSYWYYNSAPDGAVRYRIHIVPQGWFTEEGGIVNPEWWPNPPGGGQPALILWGPVNQTVHDVFYQ